MRFLGSGYIRNAIATIVALALCTAVALAGLGGATAGARTPRQVKTVALLSLARGSFEISLGTAPAWLPLAGTPETLTLIAGPPAHARASTDNAYVGFVAASGHCAPTPATSRATFYALGHFYASADSAARHAGVFAPDGGAAASTSIDSVGGVEIHQSTEARACIWLASTPGTTATPTSPKRHKRPALKSTLAATLVLVLLNHSFGASVSNLTGATAGTGGFTMDAFDGGQAFRYRVNTTQCGTASSDAASVAAGTPASESISVSTSPCPSDASTFTFSVNHTTQTLRYPMADALAIPAITVGVGACELDPLTGVTVTHAEQYLRAVGCRVGQVEVTPFRRPLPRGRVSWASVDGGVAELAPAGTPVDLVVNGRL